MTIILTITTIVFLILFLHASYLYQMQVEYSQELESKLHDINVESYKPTLEDIARSGGVEIKEESN